MNIDYANSAIRTLCDRRSKAVKKLGAETADKLAHRLQQLEAAETLQDISNFGTSHRGPRLHWLQGRLAGSLAVNITGKLRLIFKPKNTSLKDYKQIDSIIIIQIKDIHK